MRYNAEISGLMKNRSYKYARELLDSLLKGEIPDEKILKKLYKNLYKKIIEITQKTITKPTSVIRQHDNATPIMIADARLSIGKDKAYQNIQNSLLRYEVPDKKYLKKFFGEYSNNVSNAYKIFIEAKKLRKSGISMTCHHNRVACTSYKLIKDNPEAQRYAAIAALHDFIEDLMYSIKDDEGKRYTIENYQEFLDKFLPKELQEPIKLLTNHYDMILKYVDYHLDRRGKRFSKDNVLEFLKNLDYETYTQLKDFVRKIIDIVENSPYTEMSSKNYLEEIKWECYSKLYIPELVKISYNDKEHLLLLIKLVDLSDNNHGLDSMDIHSKIKNIRKSVMTADLISKLDGQNFLDAYVREIRENALIKAEFLVIKDLIHHEAVQDFFVDALLKIGLMKDVFYVK
jgi:hypothetical protein